MDARKNQLGVLHEATMWLIYPAKILLKKFMCLELNAYDMKCTFLLIDLPVYHYNTG